MLYGENAMAYMNLGKRVIKINSQLKKYIKTCVMGTHFRYIESAFFVFHAFL